MHNILLKIIEKKKLELSQNKNNLLFKEKILSAKNIGLIAEVKFASPTNPNLGSKEKLLDRVKKYEKGGADAISIITEKYFFKGDVKSIELVREQIKLPVLQKDFVIDKRQIYQAKEVGSDALLLIARLVDKKTLQSFVELCFELDIEPVVEMNNEEDLKKTLATKTNIIAVNARNLENFKIDIDAACKLIKKIPNKYIKLGFSGINSKKEVIKYKNAGARGVLVGTSLMKTENIKEFIERLKT